MFISVVLHNSTRGYDRFYDYKVPKDLESFVIPGIRVLVPFGKGIRLREAFVMEVKAESSIKGIKEICQVIDESPVLIPELLQLCMFMKKRYICTYDLAIRCMLPTGLDLLHRNEVLLNDEISYNTPVNEQEILTILKDNNGKMYVDELQKKIKTPIIKLLKQLEDKNIIQISNRFQMKAKSKTVKTVYAALDPDEYQEMVLNNQIRNLNYIRVMEILFDEGESPVNELNMLGFSTAILKNMQKKGLLDFSEELVDRNPLDDVDVAETKAFEPTPSQNDALEKIYEQIDSGTYQELLLHGVTGSGKTEVYLQAISKVIEKGKSAIMLVPEIGLTPQTVRLFKGRFGNCVAVMHSRLSMGERFDQWNKIKNGEIKVVIGARSAVFVPLLDIGIIIIDEEHESSYKSDRTPKYDVRTISAARCRFHNALLIYGSATPSVENYYRAVSEKITLVEMMKRTNDNPLPLVKTIDMRNEINKSNEFSNVLIQELQKNKDAGEKSMLFINRRGHSNFLLCRECGYLALCPYCSVSLTWHQTESRLVCHYCSYATIKPDICPKCKSKEFHPFGLGTQKVEEVISKIEPGFSVIRMDFDTTIGKRGHQKILDSFRENNIDVLVGTQMIAKGHDFPDVTLVGILNADSLLGSGDYRASERTFQLITQSAGRAGRATKQGRVVLQTYNVDDFSIQAAVHQDYKAFFDQEIKLRKELKLPPFFQFGCIQITGKNNNQVRSVSRKIYSEITRRLVNIPDVFLSDPAPSPIMKIKNRYRWRIILKHQSIKTLGNILEWVYDTYGTNAKGEWSVSVDINPGSML